MNSSKNVSFEVTFIGMKHHRNTVSVKVNDAIVELAKERSTDDHRIVSTTTDKS